MKKAMKKLMAALLAVAMVCAMVAPAWAASTTEDISNHSFSAFQIFKGTVNGNTLSNVEWGSSIATNSADFLSQLKADTTIGGQFASATTVQDVLDIIGKWHDSDDNSLAFASFVYDYFYPTPTSTPSAAVTSTNSNKLDFTTAGAGYYLIVDTTSISPSTGLHFARNSFLLKVTEAKEVTVQSKVEKPSVKKEVYDNQDGTDNAAGFGSSADHAINEEFQFRLTATVPASTDRAYDHYDKYAVFFNDTLSKGITYDRLDKVIIESNGATYDITSDISKYYIDTTQLESLKYFVVGIPDVKTCATGLNLNNGATITVTYTAHLNENAYVNTDSGKTENKNEVLLQYSNNPKDYYSYGYTPKDEVYVFAYQLNNTKYHDEEASSNTLPDAGFRLYSDKDCLHEVELYKEGNFYYPIKNATGKTAVEMKSAADGTFNVKGLDAGTYYLRETTTPDYYNTCPDTEIIISATHNKDTVTLSNNSNLKNAIINKSGTTLPGTGGIGTTIFYVIGGGLMVAAGVLLITKKRMENR